MAEIRPMLTDGELRNRFAEVRNLVGMNGELKSINPSKFLKTNYGTPIKRGVELESGNLKVMVDPYSGEIMSLQAKHDYPQDNEPEMDKERAVGTMAAALHKMGVTIGQDLKEIYRGYDAETDRWGITWERQMGGYPFPEATIFVTIEDDSANLVFYKNCTPEGDCSPQQIVEEKKAKEAAVHRTDSLRLELYGEDYSVASMTPGTLQYVYPNGAYLAPATNAHTTTELTGISPSLVYSYSIAFKYIGTNAHSIATRPVELWIDATNCSFVGGL